MVFSPIMSKTEVLQHHDLTFFDYMQRIADHIDKHSTAEFESRSEAITSQILVLEQSSLWQAAYSISTGREYSEHPCIVYLHEHSGENVHEEELWTIFQEDNDALTKSLQRYLLYRKGTVFVINRVFRETLEKIESPTSVSEMKRMFIDAMADETKKIHDGDEGLLPDYLLEDARLEQGKLLYEGLSSEMLNVKQTICDLVFDTVIEFGLSQDFPKDVSDADIEKNYPLFNSLFTTVTVPLPHSHTTCPAINHARIYYRLLIQKALPYWQAGGKEEDLEINNFIEEK